MEAIRSDFAGAGLTPRELALCRVARCLTREVRDFREGSIEELRAAGLDDRAILDLVQIVGYFNFVNRLAEGLGVELEATER